MRRNIKKERDFKRIEDYENSLKDEMPLGLLASIMESACLLLLMASLENNLLTPF